VERPLEAAFGVPWLRRWAADRAWAGSGEASVQRSGGFHGV